MRSVANNTDNTGVAEVWSELLGFRDAVSELVVGGFASVHNSVTTMESSENCITAIV